MVVSGVDDRRKNEAMDYMRVCRLQRLCVVFCARTGGGQIGC